MSDALFIGLMILFLQLSIGNGLSNITAAIKAHSGVLREHTEMMKKKTF